MFADFRCESCEQRSARTLERSSCARVCKLLKISAKSSWLSTKDCARYQAIPQDSTMIVVLAHGPHVVWKSAQRIWTNRSNRDLLSQHFADQSRDLVTIENA